MTRKSPTVEPRELPDWFREDQHTVGPHGIIETATGTLLAPDGLPASTALRLKRERDAAALTEGVNDAS